MKRSRFATTIIPRLLLFIVQDQQLLFVVKGAKDLRIDTNYRGKPRSADSLKALAKNLADHF